MSRSVAMLAALATFAPALACGVAVAPLEAFDVVVTPNEDCTLTGATSRDCVDPAVLAAQRTKGRWIFEHDGSGRFSVTTEDGVTLPGLHFADDGRESAVAPTCEGLGGLCYFARRRFEIVDDRQGGCTRFSELVAILRRTEDGALTGVLSDATGATETCGTSSVLQRIDGVAGTLVDEPALARTVSEDEP